MYVEGLVHITELGGEYYRFDEARQELRGERSGMRYALGTRVRVQVSRVDLDGRKIDFRLIHESEDKSALVSRAMRDKAGSASVEPLLQERDAGPRRNERAPAASSRQAPADRLPQTPPESRKTAVKKAAGTLAAKQGKKPRR